ncbi:MAG: hypothetical protein LBM02_06870 [Lachnospiraceae bacterium]|jgi:predicted alpha/beta superfamily hydrolase|nr:hypothetical protein [Lachnospiraceae bacterium]
MYEELEISGKRVFIKSFGISENPEIIYGFFSSVTEKDLQIMEEKLSDDFKCNRIKPFILTGLISSDWNKDYSPWKMEKIYKRDEDFSGGGHETLEFVIKSWIPFMEKIFGDHKKNVMGYSLGGLFAMWLCLETGKFHGVGSLSGSLWFKDIVKYVKGKEIDRNARVYLSLGENEEKTRNQIMSKVGDNTREIYEILRERVDEITLEMNSGGHFNDVDERVLKGIRWMMR